MASDQNVELQITAKNLTQDAFDQVVASLKSIGDAASQLGESGGAGFGEMFAAMTGGVITGEALTEAFDKATEVVGELGDKILELGERGGQIQGVEEAFQQFSGGAEQANANLEALRAGTQGTVDDFVLMQGATKDLSSGIKLSSADFQTLGQGAVILAKQMGTDTASAFDTLNNALATGRTRALQLMGVHVDLDAATQHYAATLGTTSDNLTMAQKRAATAAAVMDQLRQRVQAAGDVQLTFGQRIEQVETYFVNLEDEVAKGIAQSPVLEAGFNGVAHALEVAFGGDQQNLVNDIVSLVNDLAIVLVKMAEAGVTGVQVLGDSWYGLKELVAGVENGIATALLGLLPTIDKVSGALQYMGGPEGAAFAVIHQQVGQLQTDLTSMAATSAATFINAGADSVEFDTKLQTLHDNLGKTVIAMEAAAAAGPKVADGMSKGGNGIDGGSGAIQPKVQSLLNSMVLLEKQFEVFAQQNGLEAAAKKFGTQFDSMELKAAGLGLTFDKLPPQFQADVGKINEGMEQLAIDKMDEKIKTGIGDILTSLDKLSDQPVKMFPQIAQGYKEIDDANAALNDLIVQNTETSSAYQIQKINDWVEKQLEAYKGDQANYVNYAATIRAEADQKTDALIVDAKKLQDESLATLQDTADREWNTYFAMQAAPKQYSDAAIAAQKKIAVAAQQDADDTKDDWVSAFSNLGNDLEQALPGVISAFGSGGLSGGIKQLATTLGSDLGGDIGFAVGGPLGESIGKAIGSLAGPLTSLIGDLFGSAGRDAVTQFAATFQGGFAGLHQQLDQLGAQGEQLWIQLTQGTGNNNAAQAQQNIAAVTAALNTLHTSENNQFSNIITQLQNLGGAIPPALDPYIQKLQQAGILTQQNADALTALEGNGTPTYQTLTALQQKYNLTAAQMGPSFQAQNIDANFQTIIDDINTLTTGGGNLQQAMFDIGTNGAQSLSGLGTAIQGDIQDAINAGVAIPSNLKDAAQALINQGDLLTANGQKITDINSLTFGETMQTSIDSLNKTLQTLIDTLTGGSNSLEGALTTIGGMDVEPTIKVNTDWSSLTNGPGVSGGVVAHASGAYIREDHVAQVHSGEIIGPMDFMTRALTGALSSSGVAASITAGGFQVSPIMMDGQKVADLIVRRIPNSVQRFGVRGGSGS